jgi:hypothetical protein
MSVDPSTCRHLDDHLGQAEFALKVASNFECLKGTPAHDAVRLALTQVAGARNWVHESLTVERAAVKTEFPQMGQGLPLTRAERMGYRWP